MTRPTPSDARRNLWISACVIGFSVVMSCLLLTFKYRAAYEALEGSGGLDEATLQFAQRLFAWGGVIAIVATLVLFLLLNFLSARLEERLARVREALAGEADRSARLGSLTAQAGSAHRTIEGALRELRSTRASLETTLRAPR